MSLREWMQEAVLLQARAQSLDEDVIHDLRVALRRCRALAQGLRAVDVADAERWRTLADAGKTLFDDLGGMRDAQVMRGWLDRLLPGDEPIRGHLLAVIDGRIAALVDLTKDAIAAFDVTSWQGLSVALPDEAARLLKNHALLLHLVLRRFHEAHALHLVAVRTRTPDAFHALRIGVKKLRYTLESFAPALADKGVRFLKKMQEELGDVHDLDVLLTSVAADPSLLPNDRERIAGFLLAARRQRLQAYSRRATGRAGAWAQLRRLLPRADVAFRAHRAFILELLRKEGVDGRAARLHERTALHLARTFVQPTGPWLRLAALLSALRPRRARRVLNKMPLAVGFLDKERAAVAAQLEGPLVRAARPLTALVAASRTRHGISHTDTRLASQGESFQSGSTPRT